MKVLINTVHFKVDQKLVDFIQTKLDKLEQFYSKVIDAEVYLHVLNISEKDNKTMELKLRVPSETFLVKKQAPTFEQCVDLCADSMRRKLRKQNEKPKEISNK